MKQKILYILLMITALIGGNGEAWAQSGYILREINNISFTRSENELSNITNNLMTISNTTNSDNCDITIIFTFGQSDILYQNSAGLHLTIRGKETNEFKWSVPDYCAINITYFRANVTSSLAGKMEFVSSGGHTKTQSVGWSSNNVELTGMNLDKNGKITLSTNNNSYDYYIHNLTFTYNISYYKLDISSLESAITTANNALGSITDETMKSYLDTAIANANSFKAECAFPKSYWNGSPVGKTPADVTAITNYLSAYQNALTTIATAENSFDKTYDQETLTADIENAKTQLKLATDVNGINTALANIKGFDTITFNAESEIEEEATLPNPAASAKSGKVITYESSDDTIIEIDGTTLKALKPGTVTITAKTATGDGYYGYTTTKEFTVTPKAVILNPDKECTIVPNIVYPEITLERSFSAKTHYTLTLPFDSNISDIGGDYAAQLALVTYNKADGYTLYFQKVTDGQMVANQPYIVYAENGFNESLKWANITVAETIEAKEVDNDRTQGWTMQGNYTPGFPMTGNYGIAGGKLCIGGADSYINAYTAYFTFLGTENVRTRVAVMDEGGNTTYIGELKDLNGNAAEEVFGIDGMRLPEMRKGINIVRQKDGSVRKIVK